MTFRFRSAALALFVAVLPGCTTPVTPASREAGVTSYDLSAANSYIEAGYKGLGLPGASLAVAKDGEVVYAVLMTERDVGGPVINEPFDPWKLIDLVHAAIHAGK